MQVNWNAIYRFWLVSRYGSFAAAARALPWGTVQALHKQIRQLEGEQHLNLRLLRSRGVKGVQLTEAGRRLCEVLDPFFRSFEVLAGELRGEDSGPLSVVMSSYAIYNYAEDILRDFHRSFPKVSIRILRGEPAEAVSLLEQGRADVGVFSPTRLSREVAVAARSPIRFELVAPRSYRLDGRFNSWARLVEYPFVLTDRGTVVRQALEELLRRNDLLARLQIGAEVATFDLAIEAVRAGCGVGIIPVGPRLEGRLRSLSRVEPPPGLPGIDIAVLCRSNVYLPRYHRYFIDVAAGAIGSRGELRSETAGVQ